MSTAIAKNFQVGSDGTATNNFTIRQPATPDGTVRIANGNSGTTTDLVTVTSAGNVGVGTTSPGAKLDVYSTSSEIARIQGGSAGAGYLRFADTTNTNIGYVGRNNTSDLYIWQQAAGGSIRFGTVNNQVAQLDSSGNFGLGVTPSADWASSGYKAFVVRTSFLAGSTAPGVMVLGNNAYNDGAGWKYVATGVASYYVQNAGAHSWSYAPSGTAGNTISFTQAMTLDASGNLGVGTTSPGQKLTVGANGVFRLQTGSVTMDCTPTPGATDGFVWNTSASSYYTWSINSSERARITSGGDFLVGTTSSPLSAAGRGNITINGSSTAIMSLTIGGVNKGYIFHDDSSMEVWNADNSYMRFGTNNAERVRISAAGGFSVGTTSDPGAGAIYATGNITAYFSDNRLKTRLGGIEGALDKVEKLSGFYYEANETAQALGYKPKREVGVSAQEVQAVLPEVVSPAPVDQQYLTVDYERLVPLLIEAIKELRAEVRALKVV